jgi:hypothetical protein
VSITEPATTVTVAAPPATSAPLDITSMTTTTTTTPTTTAARTATTTTALDTSEVDAALAELDAILRDLTTGINTPEGDQS